MSTKNTYFVGLITLYSCLWLCFPSCNCEKKTTANQAIPSSSTQSSFPNSFKARIKILSFDRHSTDDGTLHSVKFLIQEILEQGSSLIYIPSVFDTLTGKPAGNYLLEYLKPNISLQGIIEERPQMGTEQPLFIIKHLQAE